MHPRPLWMDLEQLKKHRNKFGILNTLHVHMQTDANIYIERLNCQNMIKQKSAAELCHDGIHKTLTDNPRSISDRNRFG